MRFTKYNNPAKRRKRRYSRPMPDDIYQIKINEAMLAWQLMEQLNGRNKELDDELWEKIEETGDVWHREEVKDAE